MSSCAFLLFFHSGFDSRPNVCQLVMSLLCTLAVCQVRSRVKYMVFICGTSRLCIPPPISCRSFLYISVQSGRVTTYPVYNVFTVITYFFPGPDFTWWKILGPDTTYYRYNVPRLQRIHRYNVLFPRSRFHVMENCRSGYNVLSLQCTVIRRLDCIDIAEEETFIFTIGGKWRCWNFVLYVKLIEELYSKRSYLNYLPRRTAFFAFSGWASLFI